MRPATFTDFLVIVFACETKPTLQTLKETHPMKNLSRQPLHATVRNALVWVVASSSWAALTGCFTLNTKIPAEWSSAMDRVAPATAKRIEGICQNGGQTVGREGGGGVIGASLISLINGFNRGESPLPQLERVELRLLQENQLEVSARSGTEVLGRKVFAAEIDAGGVFLEGKQEERANRRKGQTMKIRTDGFFMVGADGCLYVQSRHRASTKLKGVVPFAGGENVWARFEPAQ
jgi:hypothetical protein